MKKIKVLVVDDSALMRQLLTEVINDDPNLEVIGTASDPYIAWEKIQRLKPDVLTLDVEMPRMDGLTFLEKLMTAHPIPVVMVSSLTEKGCETTLHALELGAMDFVAKPKIDLETNTVVLADEIIDKLKTAAKGRVRPAARPVQRAATSVRPVQSQALIKSTHKVLAIGGSTGGTEALREVLTALPADSPGVVVVIHMPEGFTRSYAQRLDGICEIRVKEAAEGDRILPGHALIAPGNYHMKVCRSGASYVVHIESGDPVNRHRPSVDVLFDSCASYLGPNAVGAILTGMGNDGAKGLLAMRKSGAHTLAQDEASCVVFGMPKEAIALDAAEEILPLSSIAERMLCLGR